MNLAYPMMQSYAVAGGMQAISPESRVSLFAMYL
jgi:hypothetical protein